jgi:hypothetical protein
MSLPRSPRTADSADSDTGEPDDLDPDAHALAEAIRQITPLLTDHVELYSDLRRRFVDRALHQPVLSFQSDVILEYEGGAEPHADDSQNFRQQLAFIAQLLQQFTTERAAALNATQETIDQLKAENRFLSEELSRYRQQELDELREQDSDDENRDDDFKVNPSESRRTPIKSPWSQKRVRTPSNDSD